MKLTKLTDQYYDELKAMYFEYFPKAERKPFEQMITNDYIDVWLYLTDGKIGGFAFVLKGSDAVLLDYLAVNKSCRSGGVGRKIVQELKKAYSSVDGIYIEIERLGRGDNDDVNKMRTRRHKFYISNHFQDCDIFIKLMGVDMQLMYLPVKTQEFSFADYTATYINALGRNFIDENIELKY